MFAKQEIRRIDIKGNKTPDLRSAVIVVIDKDGLVDIYSSCPDPVIIVDERKGHEDVYQICSDDNPSYMKAFLGDDLYGMGLVDNTDDSAETVAEKRAKEVLSLVTIEGERI